MRARVNGQEWSQHAKACNTLDRFNPAAALCKVLIHRFSHGRYHAVFPNSSFASDKTDYELNRTRKVENGVNSNRTSVCFTITDYLPGKDLK
jgi:hypothetical protein